MLLLTLPCAVCALCCMRCSETETKQLNGWKATVENLLERFEDLVKQTQLLQEIDDSQAVIHSSRANSVGLGSMPMGPAAEAAAAAADAAAAAIAAEEGTAGPLAANTLQPRSSVLTTQHHLQLNKLRCVPHAVGFFTPVVCLIYVCVCGGGGRLPAVKLRCAVGR